MKLFESISAYPESPFEKKNGLVFDKNTGLYWEVKSANEDDVNFGGKTFTFAGAADVHAKALNDANYGGFNDWRVPNKDELRSIFDYSHTDGVIDNSIFGFCPVGDYWTQNIYRLQDYFGWVLYSGFGSGIAKRLDAQNYVLCVRGGKSINGVCYGESNPARFTDNGDGTVTDCVTGLMWQKETNLRMGPKAAEEFCAKLTLAGYSDWRLPNIKELNTILNLDVKSSSWLFPQFPMPENEKMLHYAANGVFENHFAWVTNFTMGYDGYYGGRDAALLSRAVRYADGAKVAAAKQSFEITHTGQKTAFDLKGREVTSDRIWGLDAQRIWKEVDFEVVEQGKAVLDRVNGLLWDNAHEGLMLTWKEAQEYVAALNDMHYLGKTGWRLPGREELRSLVVYDDAQPAINRAVFKEAKADFYWAGTTEKTNTDLAWGFYFGYGCVICYPKTRKSYFRAVCAPDGAGDPFLMPSKERFIVNADKTVTDRVTGLMWMQEETPLLKQKEALEYCKNLRLGGYDDWVMPSVKELATLINLNEGEEWYYKELFPNTNTKPQGFYQSSTVFGGTFGWGCNFQFGFDGYYADRMNGAYPFRPVRRVTR